MNKEERAAYYIGRAVLRQLEHAPRDPDALLEISVVSRWIEHWLTDDEYVHVAVTTGYDFAEELTRDLPPGPTGGSSSDGDDGIPF
jgi:hypothetical protein